MGLSPSFRDPAGFAFSLGDRFLRFVATESVAEFEAFFNSPTARSLIAKGGLIPTARLSDADQAQLRGEEVLRVALGPGQGGAFFEHERVVFPSYPYEWPPEMLLAAGALTLDLAEASLSVGFGLKDATPYNVLFRGSRPVFVDAASFEKRTPGDAVWKAYAQFVRTFLLPLLVNRTWGIRTADIFTTHRDGLETEEVYRLCGWFRRMTPPYLGLVTLPTWLAGREGDGAAYRQTALSDPEKAQFILSTLLRRLRRSLFALRDRGRKSTAWSDYMREHSYTEETFAAKEAFVRQVLAECHSRRVLDVGANTGHFSLLATEAGAGVISIDSDAACIGRLWEQSQAKGLDLQPLVVDFARPSPPTGWRNGECASFLERARNSFDCVLMLAVVHHLLVSERIPLDQILGVVSELTTDAAVIEFVGPEDPMFRKIARGRDHLFTGLTTATFEEACRQRFEVVRSLALTGTHRRLYLLRRRRA